MSREIYRRSVGPHLARIAYDGGTETRDVQALIALQRYYEQRKDTIKLLYCSALTGNKIRVSGANSYISKGYDFGALQNDAVQSTALNQPLLGGNIALNEKLCAKNTNGGGAYLTHQTISFGTSDAWSVTFVIKSDFSNLFSPQCLIRSTAATNNSMIRLGNYLEFWNESGSSTFFSTESIYKYIGKNVICTLVADGVGNISLYINGVFIATKSKATNFIFNSIFDKEGGQPRYFGKIMQYAISSQALTSSEVASEAALLRSVFTEIESVQIGSKVWATSNFESVSTPQGNLIQEMQSATNVEKITNAADRDFSSDTGWWSKGAGSTINSGGNGICKLNSAGDYISRNAVVTIGKWYKITYEIKRNGGELTFRLPGVDGNKIVDATVGIHSVYGVSSQVYIAFQGSATGNVDIDLDNVSWQEVGWSDSQNLYDSIYAATSGTVEQKTYAAVKAAAMWCHYNNDPAIGAIYGKILNGFARRLLNMDLAYYNAAYPATPWGWSIGLKSQLQTLAAFGGNALKVAGNVYMNDANGINSTGFTALGQGKRNTDGTFANIKSNSTFWTQDTNEVLQLNSVDNNASIVSADEREGHAIRFIKA